VNSWENNTIALLFARPPTRSRTKRYGHCSVGRMSTDLGYGVSNRPTPARDSLRTEIVPKAGTMTQIRAARLEAAGILILLLVLVGSCKRESQDGAGALTASLLFDNASPEVREALSSRVDFRIDDDNFARWEAAQDNLDELPRSAIKSTSTAGGGAVDRAVARLQSSPRARRAIERAGLSVREFVLATIALAQATEAAQTGRSMSPVPVPPENFQFVQRYNARVLRSRNQERVARADAGGYDIQFDTSGAMADSDDTELQMRLDQAEHEAEMRLGEIEMRREEAEREAEMHRERDERRKRDSARDTVPALH
jgi:hypothetical protein